MMKRKTPRFTRLLTLCATLVLTCALFAIGASAATATQKENMAQALYSVGLFKGYDETGTNFGLNDVPTREQALIFQIRAMGEDAAALAWTGPSPYRDVPSNHWALNYIGYGTEKGYTNGMAPGVFGVGKPADAKMMTTFVLRGMGYADTAGDFTYNNAVAFGNKKGINETATVPATFNRGDAVVILYNALSCERKSGDTLADALIKKGAFTKDAYEVAKAIAKGEPVGNFIKADFDFVNLTGKTIKALYMTTSDTEDWGASLLSGSTFKTDYTLPLEVTFTKSTKYDVLAVYSDNTQSELRGLSFASATKDGGTIVLKSSSITLYPLINVPVTFVNKTGVSLTSLKASSVLVDEWSSNLISTVSNGSSTKINFPMSAYDSKWDIQVVAGNKTYEFRNLDMSKVSTSGVTFYLTLENGSLVIAEGSASAPTAIDLKWSDASVVVGKTFTLPYTLSPSNASSTVTFTSSNSAVVKVDSKGVVTGVKAGTATITAKTANGKVGACIVTAVTSTNPTKVVMDVETLNLGVGETYDIEGKVWPIGATISNTWTSSNSAVAKVSSSGVVTGVAGGTATITVKTSNGKTDTCKVTVSGATPTSVTLNTTSSSLAVGKTLQLTAKVLPTNAVQTINWTSSDSTIAAVNSTSGLVTAKKAGTATITAFAANGVNATCKITVTGTAALTKANFDLQNQTGKTIKELYMTTSNTTDWGANLVPQNGTLASGYAVTLEISFDKTTKYDILAKYTDGTQGDFRGLSFANATDRGGVLVLKGSDVTLYPQITVPITIFNMTGAKINELRFSSSKNAEWGESRGSIGSGGSLALTFTLSAYDTKFDLQAKRASDILEFKGMDLTDVPASGAKFYLYLQNGEPRLSTTKPVVEEVVDKTVKLYNCHTSNMTRIECSSSKLDSWSSNLITTTVKPDATGSIIVPVSASDYEFDLRVTYADGKTAIFSKYDFRSFTSGGTLYAYFENGSPYLSTTKPAVSETYTNKTLHLYNSHTLGATSIRISSTKNDTWGPNLLTSTLTAGSKVEILIPVSASDYTYDIEFQYTDGSSTTYSAYNFKNFTSGGTLYAYIEGSSAYLSATKPTPAATASRTVTITFVNSSSKNIAELYASSSGLSTWGSNLISGSSSSMRVQFTVTDSDYLYDLRLVDASGADYQLFGLNLKDVTGAATFEIVDQGSGLGWK